jgi:hypothetical protein
MPHVTWDKLMLCKYHQKMQTLLHTGPSRTNSTLWDFPLSKFCWLVIPMHPSRRLPHYATLFQLCFPDTIDCHAPGPREGKEVPRVVDHPFERMLPFPSSSINQWT